MRFAKNIKMIADSKDNLEKMLYKLYNTLKEEYNMMINKTKTQTLFCSRQQVGANIIVDTIKLETINSYTHLGSKITTDNNC